MLSTNSLQFDSEIFDDNDFYQVLLKEVIELGGQSVQATQEAQRPQKKLKKNRDKRGNKDKQIKYDVHEKLVGFMAPVYVSRTDLDSGLKWSYEELFANLFGAQGA